MRVLLYIQLSRDRGHDNTIIMMINATTKKHDKKEISLHRTYRNQKAIAYANEDGEFLPKERVLIQPLPEQFNG